MKTLSPSDCDNCGTPLEGEYCHRCGQRKIDFKSDWKGLSHEVFSSMFNFEGKLLVGFADIAFRPWKVTREFLEGQRVSKMPPFRTYLFVSLLFFLNIAADFTDGFSNGVIIADEAEMQSAEKFNEVEVAREMGQHLMKWTPRVFLVGVVILALLLKIVFFRSNHVYIEHLIVALNLQSFVFLWITVADGWGSLFGLIPKVEPDVIMDLLLIWLLICPVIAFKNIYETGWFKAVLKSFFVFSLYSVYLVVALIITIVISAKVQGLV